MTPAGIEPATFRFVAQHLNHCVTVVPFEPHKLLVMLKVKLIYMRSAITLLALTRAKVSRNFN